MTKHLVFVYGTLRKHEGNHGLLLGAECVRRQCWTRGRMFDSTLGYPFLAASEENKVYGELYKVDDRQLQALDGLEGYYGPGKNNYYNRGEQLIHTDTESYMAFVYTLPEDQEPQNMRQIEDGDWCVDRFLREQNQSYYYFAYGSCMDHERFQQAGVDHFFQKVIGKGVLDGYQLQFTIRSLDGGRADIVEKGGTVEGIVYEIPAEALAYLYRREGVSVGCYRPAVIELTINGTVVKNVLTFIVVNKEEESAPPEHYAEEIFRGGSGYLSDSYLADLNLRIEELRTR
ncbi:gamma-glutamylcyclotransferase [Neobacillus kokaensis]|uniref:Gamma-glutamylcyclotransferase YkqA n=1 Tax=Neobacillus kokaensis TaxID=2759023 RepID=A0ABQ3MZW4_9BACI|nr:gamma-glutamylcyclotransferase family protein [Neobacillus kokaensis]GHH96937.1 putative gamma-glutamylcyclotransferase YkqA [Neobacillus kokaensis]